MIADGLLQPRSDLTRGDNYRVLDYRHSCPSKRGVGFGPPFLITYVLGVIFAEPWRIASWQELWMFAVMFLMLALWVAAGCIIGGVPAVLAVWIGAKLRQRLER